MRSGFIWLLAASSAIAVELPDGFELATVGTGLTEPIALNFAPDGALLVAERGGGLRWIRDEQVEDPFTHIEVRTSGEMGLLGVALGPDFSTTRHIYVLATVSFDEQRILRIHADTPEDPLVIRGNLPAGTVHNGGCLRIGPDGHLYFSIGDTGLRDLAQDVSSLAGKISRVALDGSVPDDNPFVTITGSRRAVLAMGFRNPFRFCFSAQGRLYVGDVGSSDTARREELNVVSPGDNAGWPDMEGASDATAPSHFIDPVVAYREDGASISGCAVYDHVQFPADYHGDVFHVDYVSDTLFHVALHEDGSATRTPWATTHNGPVDLTVGPDGSLFIANIRSGTVQRLRYPAGPTSRPNDSDPSDTVSPIVTQPPSPDDDTGTPETFAPASGLCGAGAAAAGWVMAGVFLVSGIRTRWRIV